MASAITPAKSGAAGAPLAQSCTPLHTVARRTTSAHSPDGMHAATPAPAAQAAARPIPLNTAVRPKPKQVRYAKSTYARLKECVSEDHAVINAHVHAVWLVIPESERAKCGHDITQFTAYATASIRRRLKASATVARSAKRKRLSQELIAPEPRMLAPIASKRKGWSPPDHRVQQPDRRCDLSHDLQAGCSESGVGTCAVYAIHAELRSRSAARRDGHRHGAAPPHATVPRPSSVQGVQGRMQSRSCVD